MVCLIFYPFCENIYVMSAVILTHKIKDDRTVGWKTCCKSPTLDLQCVRKYSSGTGIGAAPITTSVFCSSGYEMVGCSGYGLYNELNSFWINGDEGCYARGAASNPVYAIAIWYVIQTIPTIKANRQ